MWYSRVSRDISQLPDFINHYESEIPLAKAELKVGGKIESHLARLPGITETRFSELQDIEAVLNYLNIQLRQLRRKHFQKYLENYNRALTSRDAEKYTDGNPEVIDMEILINEVALLRNRYLAIIKGLDSLQWQLSNITKLRAAGLEDALID